MTANVQLSKEEQMIAFFVNQLGGDFGRTALMKYMYLADYEARRFLGKPISEIEYVWHHYGPYDHNLPEIIERLGKKKMVSQEKIQWPTGQEGYRFRPGDVPAPYSFSPEELLVLQYVCEQYSKLDLQALLEDVVYATEPMKDAQDRKAKQQPINMDLINGIRQNELGIPFDELLRRSIDARGGATLTMEQVRAELIAAVGVAA